MLVMRMTSQQRRGTAAQDRPIHARPRAPPAPVHGRGPGKRVQVKGNSRQNVSISSNFFLIYYQHQIIVMFCWFVVFSLLNPLPFLCYKSWQTDWSISFTVVLILRSELVFHMLFIGSHVWIWSTGVSCLSILGRCILGAYSGCVLNC